MKPCTRALFALAAVFFAFSGISVLILHDLLVYNSPNCWCIEDGQFTGGIHLAFHFLVAGCGVGSLFCGISATFPD